MKSTDPTPPQNNPKQPSKKRLKIKIKTDKNKKVQVFDAETGERLRGFSRLNLYVDMMGRVCADLSIKDVELDIEIDNAKLKRRNQGSK